MTHQILAFVASDNSKLHKIAAIRAEAEKGNNDFFAGLRYAYDKIDTFGVKKVPFHSGVNGPGLSFVEFSALANDLIKRNLSGGAAQIAIENAMSKATKDEWDGWYRLILTKDLRAGFSESTVNKAVKGINPAYVIPTTPYMRCSLPEKSNMPKWVWKNGIYSQTKADGIFANVNKNAKGELWVTSRGGTEFPEGSLGIEICLGATFNNNTQTHGELTVYQDGVLLPRKTGNGILNSLLKGGDLLPNQVVVYDCWDQIPLTEATPKNEYKVPYKKRFALVSEQVNAGEYPDRIRLTETRIVYSSEEARIHYKEHRARKLEGTVTKDGEAFWKDGTSKDQVKSKEEVDVELEVVGFNPGNGKNADTFGSINFESSCGQLEVAVSGMSDDLRASLHARRQEVIGTIWTVRGNSLEEPSKSKKTKTWCIFLPRLIEERLDKDTADSLVEIQAQFKAAEAAAAPLEEDDEE